MDNQLLPPPLPSLRRHNRQHLLLHQYHLRGLYSGRRFDCQKDRQHSNDGFHAPTVHYFPCSVGSPFQATTSSRPSCIESVHPVHGHGAEVRLSVGCRTAQRAHYSYGYGQRCEDAGSESWATRYGFSGRQTAFLGRLPCGRMSEGRVRYRDAVALRETQDEG